MSGGKSICQELHYLFQILKNCNLSIKGNSIDISRKRNYITSILLTASNIFMFVIFKKNLYTFYEDLTVNKAVVAGYLLSQLLKCSALVFTLVYQRNNAIKLWNGLLELDKLCMRFKLSADTHKHAVVTLLLLSQIFYASTGCFYLVLKPFSNFNIFDAHMFLTGVITRTLELSMKLTYVALALLFKNYCVQLKEMMQKNATKKSTSRMLTIKSIVIFHEEIFDLFKLNCCIITFVIIAQFQEAFVLLVGHCYSLIIFTIYKEKFFPPGMSFYVVFDSIFNMMIFIFPTSFYCLKVRNLNRSV